MLVRAPGAGGGGAQQRRGCAAAGALSGGVRVEPADAMCGVKLLKTGRIVHQFQTAIMRCCVHFRVFPFVSCVSLDLYSDS